MLISKNITIQLKLIEKTVFFNVYVLYLYVHDKKNKKIQFFQLNSAVFWFNVYALSDFQDNKATEINNCTEI
ncbi:hypothetical protein MHK_010116 [Candidatus Magnetomorum sp. HK-1]|nr:hypothetical protein MHK_010116 [Candidatus Magnetomorum sp. HK-1]